MERKNRIGWSFEFVKKTGIIVGSVEEAIKELEKMNSPYATSFSKRI